MKIYAVPFGVDFISSITDFVLNLGLPLEEIAIVFPGRRPSLYLKENLAKRIEKPFFSPTFFSIEDFIDHLCRKEYPYVSDLPRADAVLLLYRVIDSLNLFSPGFFEGKGLGEFYGWGIYLLDFIDKLDMEGISGEKLQSLGFNAEIGYDAPERINKLLKRIGAIREAFHRMLDEKNRVTKGYKHIKALKSIKSSTLDDFKKVLFAGLFALSSTEKEIIKEISIMGKGEVLLEGNPKEWPLLKGLVDFLGGRVELLPSEETKRVSVKIYSAVDVHGEAFKAYEILNDQDSKKKAIVLPSSDALFPVLTFVTDRLKKPYNISLGYPLSRTSIFDLISKLFEAQLTKAENNTYLTTSYLNVMLNPFIKNLNTSSEIRNLIGGIKRYLTKDHDRSSITKPYITLDEVEEYGETTMEGDRNALYDLKNIHRHLFKNLEGPENLYRLIVKLEETLSYIMDHTPVRSYALSEEILRHIFESLEVLKTTEISKERFVGEDDENIRHIWDFLLNHIKNIIIPFDTKPIEPIEVLGVLETRCISFDTVIILDMEEGVFPQQKKIDPVIPIAIYDQLGIPSTKDTEEIYRYHFYRLVSSAEDIHLLYLDSEENLRSRYIEQLIWREEKRNNLLDVIPVEKCTFMINLSSRETPVEIKKKGAMLEALKRKTLTPTALDDYILCPLLFYYKHILDFNEKRVLTDDIDELDRGIVVHQILYDTFLRFKDRPIGRNVYDELIKSLYDAIEKKFKDQMETGDSYLFREIIRYKLERYLEKDIKETDQVFFVKFLEETFYFDIALDGHKIPMKGKIDRIDYIQKDNMYRIIDYKTGGKREYATTKLRELNTSSIEEIHNHIESLQLPLYVFMFQNAFKVPPEEINGELVLLQKNDREILFKTEDTKEREEKRDFYIKCAKTVLVDMFDETGYIKPFDYEYCPYCNFKDICKT
ncbi:MAG: PD-(D/E)XK nuclease family protein [Syntrophorhabdaceae bacterium]|nr:PD-(D/E)XK nuclease family protein [Syntrophorhabdaceae bacterium]